MTGEAVVVIDSVADPTDTLGLVEDWLNGVDAETDEQAETLQAGIRAAAALAVVLDAAFSAAPTLYAPGGRLQLAPLAVVSFDLAAAVHTVRQAAAVAAGVPHPPPTLGASLDLLAACAAAAGSADATRLAEIATPDPDPAGEGEGSATVAFDRRQYRCYRRFASAVLTNPLDRLIALSPDTPSACSAIDLAELFGGGIDL